MKALGIDNILGFDWLSSPSNEAMVRALEVLYSLGILDEDAKLTSPLGFQVAELPLVTYPPFSSNILLELMKQRVIVLPGTRSCISVLVLLFDQTAPPIYCFMFVSSCACFLCLTPQQSKFA